MPLISWVLSEWKLFAIGAAILAVFGAGWHVKGLKDASTLHDALAAQEVTLHKQCDDEKQITKESNDALQKNLNVISRKLTDAKRVQPSRCVVATSVMAQPAAGGGEHAGQNGISTDWLRDFAAECETYRSEVIILNDFGAAERAVRNR